jgi:PAS domain-containing protein
MSTGEGQSTTADPALASAAIAAAGDAIVTTDGHGWITSWNRAAELPLGASASSRSGPPRPSDRGPGDHARTRIR